MLQSDANRDYSLPCAPALPAQNAGGLGGPVPAGVTVSLGERGRPVLSRPDPIELAFRRGFVHAVASASDALFAGATQGDLDQWLADAMAWRHDRRGQMVPPPQFGSRKGVAS